MHRYILYIYAYIYSVEPIENVPTWGGGGVQYQRGPGTAVDKGGPLSSQQIAIHVALRKLETSSMAPLAFVWPRRHEINTSI